MDAAKPGQSKSLNILFRLSGMTMETGYGTGFLIRERRLREANKPFLESVTVPDFTLPADDLFDKARCLIAVERLDNLIERLRKRFKEIAMLNGIPLRT